MRVNIFVLLLILGEMLTAFHHWVWCEPWAYRICSLLFWDRLPLYPLYWGFPHKWMLNFVKSFFWIYWNDYVIFIFQVFSVVYHIDLWMLNHPCIPGIYLILSWCIIILLYCWIQFANILLWVFTFMFTSNIGLLFSFCICVWFYLV